MERLIGKEVKIFSKNGYFYRGILLDFKDIFLTINDRKEGVLMLKVEIVDKIVEVRK